MPPSRPLDPDELPSNLSANEQFQHVVARAVSRRGFLKSGLGLSAALFLAGPLHAVGKGGAAASAPSLLGFAALPMSTADTVTVAAGYTATVFAPWGTPLFSAGAGARWAGDGSEAAADQARQVGDNHDGLHYFPLAGSDEGLLVMNHEYTTVSGNGGYTWLFGARDRALDSAARVDKALSAHGVSVIHVKRVGGTWEIVLDSRYNRRITAATPMLLSGPAAGHALLRTRADASGTRVLGTLNNCGNGWTPWNTYLSCEENFNLYFGTAAADDARSAAQKRYGLAPGASVFGWERHHERFDHRREPNESNRFGWIVEIDPFDPASTPKKRTALGRFKHENAAFALAADQRVVIYMGDDQADDYLYKFVSDQAYVDGAGRANADLLDRGRLYVARFDAGGTTAPLLGAGEWLLLDKAANPTLAADARFASQAEVLIHARLAADAVGATKMDRPEWVAVHPRSGEVYATLTNNATRERTDAANPRAKNIYGQILRWREAGGDAAATRFEWDLFVLAGNPAVHTDRADPRAGSANVTATNSFNSPDGLAFDAAGRLWIQTDGKYSNAGDYAHQGNNQMLCADPASGEIRRFFVGPRECEVTGIAFTPDQRTLFINVQHPGEDGDSHWPEGGDALPRSATVIITKDDGGMIGS